MNFSFGGSTKKYWNVFADNFRKGGEGGKFFTTLKKGSDDLQALGPSPSQNFDFTPYTTGDQNVTEHWSRQLNPLWEGGLTKPGGSTQDLLTWGEDVAMKSSHHLFGTKYAGYGEDGEGSAATGSSAVANSDAEDPSLINGGNWQRPGSIESALRREEEMAKGTLYHDLAKTGSGRQNVKNLA